MKIMKIVVLIMMVLFSRLAFGAGHVEVLAQKGNTHFQNGEYEKAIICYKEILKELPDDSEIRYNLGVAYGNTGMWEEAIGEYEKTLEINSRYANAYYNLGIAYGNTERWEKALNVYKKLISIDPDDTEAHYNLALIGIILDDKSIVASEYEILKRLSPDHAKKVGDVLSNAS